MKTYPYQCQKCGTEHYYKTESKYIKALQSNQLLCCKCETDKWVQEHPSTYNLEACKFFDKINKELNWNLQHALNGGEFIVYTYRIDAYDKDKCVMIEYDEPFHEYKKQQDSQRTNQILNKLLKEGMNKLNIIRYFEPENRFYLHGTIRNNQRYTYWDVLKYKIQCEELIQLKQLT